MKLKEKLKPFFTKHPRLVRSARFVVIASRSFSDNAINAMGAQLAYFFIVAFFTLSVTLVYASSLLPIIKEGASEASATLFPSAITRLFDSIVAQVSMPSKIWPLVTTACASFWFSSRAIRSMMFSFDTIYNAIQAKKNYQRTYRSMLFTLVFEVLLATVIIFSVLGKTIALQVFSPLEISQQFIAIWTWLRLTFPVVLMLMSFWFFYFYLTNVKIKFIHAFPGALFTTVLWLIITNFFSLYFTRISLFPSLLGSVGSIFLFFIWIYWCSIIVLVGAVLNYHFYRWRNYLPNSEPQLESSDA
ncbi:MAG: YihY/virulence factor BrkB family protein [Eubacteriales bacterium]